jgi:hypothetical protein
MGIVYRAHDPVLDREVAIKVIPPSHVGGEAEERFQREAKLVAQMDHPAIVPIHDFGQHTESLFLVMPVVSGTSLRPFLRDKSLLLGDVLDIGIQLCDALHYSHTRGVVHRDIKPENLMVTREGGEGLRVRVMDFGLAKGSTKTRITQTGVLIGTMAYVSPEQVLSRQSDHRSDIYAIGTVLYECIVGKPPFTGEVQSILYRIVHENPTPPSSLGADIDSELEQVILACLAKEPAQRTASAEQLGGALREYRTRLHDSDRQKSVMLSEPAHFTRTAQSPFVGREKELAELQQRLNAAVTGECQFVMVGGELGTGKSRLLEELENLAKARGVRVLHGRCVEHDRAFPYQGYCEAIQEYFLQVETGSTSTQLPSFADVAADLLALFPMLAEIEEFHAAAGGAETRAPGESHPPEDRTHVFELIARTLTRIAAGRPMLLILEHLHHADVSLEALEYIVRRLGPTPTLIAGTYQTAEVDSRHPLARTIQGLRGDRRFASLVLGALSPSEHRLLLETLVGAPNLSNDLVEQLYQGTEGNPFFTKELVRSLLDSGVIERDDSGTWNISGRAGITTDALPATIQQAVENRVERLPEDLRDVLCTASVIGRSFDYRDLEVLLRGRSDLDDAVERLVKEGLLKEDRKTRGDQLNFESGVVRDVLYSQLSRRKRRSLHRRCAEEIEQREKGRLERVYPDLLYHYSEADVPEKSVEYGLHLARISLDSFSAEEALRAAKTALEFLDEEWEGEPTVEGEARLLLARAHRMHGDIDAALGQAKAAVRVFERADGVARTLECVRLAAETAWQVRRTEETQHWVQRGIQAARAADELQALPAFLSLAGPVSRTWIRPRSFPGAGGWSYRSRTRSTPAN